MIKSMLLGGAMVVALVTPAVAADFHAVSKLSVVSVQDQVLATTEGGATCTTGGTGSQTEGAGGVSLCSQVGLASAGGAFFSVSNAAPVTGANFLQVIGGAVGAP
jgi:hypothetical protein